MNKIELEIKDILDRKERNNNNYIIISKVNIIPYKWYNIIRKKCKSLLYCNNNKSLPYIRVYRENMWNNSEREEFNYPDELYVCGYFCIRCGAFYSTSGWM